MLRITCALPHPEAAAWQSLSVRLRQVFDREALLRQLDERREHFQGFVARQIAGSVPPGTYTVVRAGDWHGGRRSIVFRGPAGSFAVKAEDPGAAIEVARCVDVLAAALPVRLAVPRIRQAGEVWIQDYVKKAAGQHGTPEDLGALFALALWCGLVDLHADNLIPSPAGIALVDLECAFYTRRGLTTRQRLALSGLCEPGGELPTGLRGGLHRFQAPDPRASALSCLRALEALRTGHRPEVYERIDALPCRRVFRITATYMRFLRRRFLLGWGEEEAAREWCALQPKLRPVPPEILPAELRALLAWEVPRFRQVGDRLFAGPDEEVAAGWPRPSRGMQRLHRYLGAPHARERLAAGLVQLLSGARERGSGSQPADR
jgi:hypothetical protein